MPLTPEEAQNSRIARAAKIIEAVEKKVDEMMATTTPDDEDGWNFGSSRGEVFSFEEAPIPTEVVMEILRHYNQKGWDAMIRGLSESKGQTYKVRIQRKRPVSNGWD